MIEMYIEDGECELCLKGEPRKICKELIFGIGRVLNAVREQAGEDCAEAFIEAIYDYIGVERDGL